MFKEYKYDWIKNMTKVLRYKKGNIGINNVTKIQKIVIKVLRYEYKIYE